MLYHRFIGRLALASLPIFAMASDGSQDSSKEWAQVMDRLESGEHRPRMTFEEAVTKAEQLPALRLPTIPNEDRDRAREAVANVFEQADANDIAHSPAYDPAQPPELGVYVFVSYSMPQASIRSLLGQAHRIGASLVVRGLVDDSFPATAKTLHALVGEKGQFKGNVEIDPTLYQRFAIEQVPTFVVAESKAERCRDEVCDVVPAHHKLSGLVTLDYALERVQKVEPQWHAQLQTLIDRVRPETL